MATGYDNNPSSLPLGLLGEALYQQRMAQVQIVMMYGHIGARAALLGQNASDLFTLPEIEIERDRQDEDFRGLLLRQDLRQRVAAYRFAWIGGDGSHLHDGLESENPSGGGGHR